MCGICGFNWEDKILIKEMADSIAYRGPNQEGYYINSNISLGSRRLSIIDLNVRGGQPIYNEDKTICIVFNGEIYNFQSVKEILEKKGHKFNSNTDTEVIVHAYEEYGRSCLDLFNGMFAFAIWDSNKKELFIARDRIGEKPLYYYYKNGKFIFGSEIKSLLQYKEIKREINEDCLRQILLYAFPINGETLLKDIFELKPGHLLILKKNKIKIEKYWDLYVKESNENENFYINNIKKLLSESIKIRLISDVPLGISLSGGIDSSILTAMASRFKEDPIKTFTLGFDIADDEYNYARIVSEKYNTEHTELHLKYRDLTKAFVKVLWHMEVPFSRPAVLPVYYLSNKIKEKLTVSLVGEGSDELFAGYDRYDIYSKLPEKKEINDEQFYKQLKSKIEMPVNKKVENISSGVFNLNKEEFFSPEILKIPNDIDVKNVFGDYLKNTNNIDGSQLNKALLYEMKTEIPYYQCNKIDKTSMANSHEMRVPYLDYKLIEFAMTIPSKYKFYGKNKKIILQKIAKEILPNEISIRKKLPLVVPLSDFFEKEFVDIADNILSKKNLLKRTYYNPERIRKLIRDIKLKRVKPSDNSITPDNPYRQLLLLTNIEIWNKLFIESDNLKNPNLSINNYI